MFKKLLPKEDKYFEDFNQMISIIKEMAEFNHRIFSFDNPENYIIKMKPLETRCDEISSKITKRLNKTFVTPFDREDIFALVKRLESISDMLLGATSRVEIFGMTQKIEYAEKLSFIIKEQINELGVSIQDLKIKRENELKAVKDLESQADNIYEQALKELFKNEKDAVELIKKKEILELLEKISDKCQSTANIILTIFLKNN